MQPPKLPVRSASAAVPDPTAIHWEYESWDAIAAGSALPAPVCEFLRDLNISCYRQVVAGVAAGYLCTKPPGPLDACRATSPVLARAAELALIEHSDALDRTLVGLRAFLGKST